MMSGTDSDLLARLNALRPSSVTLNTNPAIDVVVNRPQSAEDELSRRLKRLRDGGQVPTLRQDRDRAVPASVSAHDVLDPVQWLSTDVVDNDLNFEDGSLDKSDTDKIDRLLKEARSALPPPETREVDSTFKINPATPPDIVEPEEAENGETDDTANEEREADEYVRKVLAELDLESKTNPAASDVPGDEDEVRSSLELPSAPADSASVAPPTYEDSELEARFSKLALGLPSTPDGTPVSRKAAKGAKQQYPKFTDEEIDSWCCICNEDGEVRCLGCDNDIYCQTCWHEGHGDQPGKERGHRAVQYVRKGGGLAAAG